MFWKKKPNPDQPKLIPIATGDDGAEWYMRSTERAQDAFKVRAWVIKEPALPQEYEDVGLVKQVRFEYLFNPREPSGVQLQIIFVDTDGKQHLVFTNPLCSVVDERVAWPIVLQELDHYAENTLNYEFWKFACKG
jgi:hypothetical protein